MTNPIELRQARGGIYAATIVTMNEGGEIDMAAQEAHFASVLATEGLDGLLLNGHAGEGIFLSRDEQCAMVKLAKEIAPKAKILAAVSSESSAIASADGHAAIQAGADAVMVFAPFSWALGADPRAIVTHHKLIAEAAEAPTYLFQGSVGSGKLAYTPDVLRALLEIEAIAGIKEGSWETRAYEVTRRITRETRPDVAVMASGDEHLFTCFQLGSDGSAVSLAAVIPELIVALDQAVKSGNHAKGLAIHEAIFNYARLVYAAPGHMAAARLKTCLAELGRIPVAACRAPTPRVTAEETAQLMAALRPCLELAL